MVQKLPGSSVCFIAPSEIMPRAGVNLEVLCICSGKNKEPGNIDCVNLCKSAAGHFLCLLVPITFVFFEFFAVKILRSSPE